MSIRIKQPSQMDEELRELLNSDVFPIRRYVTWLNKFGTEDQQKNPEGYMLEK